MEAEERPFKTRKTCKYDGCHIEKQHRSEEGLTSKTSSSKLGKVLHAEDVGQCQRPLEDNDGQISVGESLKDFGHFHPQALPIPEQHSAAFRPHITGGMATDATNATTTEHEALNCEADKITAPDHLVTQANSSPSRIEPQLSKNQLKKLKRKQDWEAGRNYRKVKRKEKIQEKKQRKSAARQGDDPAAATAENNSVLPNKDHKAEKEAKQLPKPIQFRSVQLPITFVFDCDFDDLMQDRERMSLAAQLTRSYSDNNHAPFKAHLAISSFGGKLKDRFDTVLSGQHQSWKGVRFLTEDFVETAEQAKEWMTAPQGGIPAGTLAGKLTGSSSEEKVVDTGELETVYLTSDSPDTLTELKPYSTYIIGGLVDRNRHKGICYKRAMDRGVKTAKLPIGEYMEMTSRFVLATNHVSEIMLKWLELGDWGEAFLKVVPKRKGGVLKGRSPAEQTTTNEEVTKECGIAGALCPDTIAGSHNE
ncbi:hypothetical protein MMC13_000328 [Lambiella insularis]|nr:hypothetical protein [Lambiella insularis]